MVYKMKDFNDYKLGATDGEIGKVKEFLFDDRYWTIRYLVADTGNWLIGRQVLIPPPAVVNINTKDKIINTGLTRKQIEESPPLETDEPVSRRFETSYCGYYGLPKYWYGRYAWGLLHDPKSSSNAPYETRAGEEKEECDPNLRSSKQVTGYNIETEEGNAGHVVDFLIDDTNWTVRYLIIDTQSWWTGKEVLIAPKWIDIISWDERTAFVKIDRNTIRQAPEYDKDRPVTRDYEEELLRYYSRRGYPVDEPLQETRPG